jgi:hypothetical protein
MSSQDLLNSIVENARVSYPAAYAEGLREAQEEGVAVHGLLADEASRVRMRLINDLVPATPETILQIIIDEPRFFQQKLNVEHMGSTSSVELARIGIISEIAEKIEDEQFDLDVAQFAFVTPAFIVEAVKRAKKNLATGSTGTRIMKSAELTALDYSLRDFQTEPTRETFDTLLSDLSEQGFLNILRGAGLHKEVREITEIVTFATRFRNIVFKG